MKNEEGDSNNDENDDDNNNYYDDSNACENDDDDNELLFCVCFCELATRAMSNIERFRCCKGHVACDLVVFYFNTKMR